MTLSRYPPETRARAALRLTEDLLEKAEQGPKEDDDQERRRLAFLRLRPLVQRIAERHVIRRESAIDDLLRVAMIRPEVFAAECEAEDARWRSVMDEAEEFIADLRDEASGRRVARPVVESGGGRPTLSLGFPAAMCDDPAVTYRMTGGAEARRDYYNQQGEGPFWSLIETSHDFEPDDPAEDEDEQHSQEEEQQEQRRAVASA